MPTIPRPPKRPQRTEKSDARYHRPRWRQVRAQVLARDKGLCQQCKALGIVATGNVADHVEQARYMDDEQFHNPNNLQILCKKCHDAKRAEEKRKTVY